MIFFLPTPSTQIVGSCLRMEIDREQDAVPLIEEAVQQTRVHTFFTLFKTNNRYSKKICSVLLSLIKMLYIKINICFLHDVWFKETKLEIFCSWEFTQTSPVWVGDLGISPKKPQKIDGLGLKIANLYFTALLPTSLSNFKRGWGR